MQDNKKLIRLAQVFISGLMALLMSGIMSLFHLGFSAELLQIWGSTFIVAWPTAFVVAGCRTGEFQAGRSCLVAGDGALRPRQSPVAVNLSRQSQHRG